MLQRVAEVIKATKFQKSLIPMKKLNETYYKIDIMLEDVMPNIDPKQYGGKKMTGTEHMMVALMDRVLSLLDNNHTKTAVIMAAADWAAAYDRGDPTKTTEKLIGLKLRPSITPLIINYMSGRSMSVKFNLEESGIYQLCGGFPQGSKIGQDCYLSASNDSAEFVSEDDKFKYIDDLQILELVMLAGILQDYNVYTHVPSDVPLDHQFLAGTDTTIQTHLDQLSEWTDLNLMKLNPEKCSYTIFSRAKVDFVTRLTVNGTKIDQKAVTKILGCWVDEDAGSWNTNTRELVKSAYSRISMLSKLKYTGVKQQDLLDIYKLFIRSRAEYLSVVWHSSLTAAQSHKIENIQKTSLKIILADKYDHYESSCEITGLKFLSVRRVDRCLAFAKRCLKNPQVAKMFPKNTSSSLDLRNTEKYVVNKARTENYRMSAVPYCQRLLNQEHKQQEERTRTAAAAERRRAAEERSAEQGRTAAGRNNRQGREQDLARRPGD
jgi:hypothetical protein